MRKIIAISGGLLLSACNQTSQPAPQSSALASAAPSAPVVESLPAGAGCSAAVSTFKKLIDSDLVAGHTTKSVHAQVSGEIAAASRLCAAGNDGGARSAISASRVRHGYPAG